MNTVVIFITPTLGFEPAVDSLRSEAGRGRHTSQDLLVKNGRSGGIRTPEAFAFAPKANPVPDYGLHSVLKLGGYQRVKLCPKASQAPMRPQHL